MTGLAWARPTRRAMRWQPLGAAVSALGVVVLALGAADAPPLAEPAVTIAVALLVAAAALALDDPGHALVAAVPVPFLRRLAHRVAWLGPATLACLCSIGWVARRLDVVLVSGSILPSAAALGSIAVAAHVLVARRRPDVAAPAAAVAPATWVVFGVSASGDETFTTVAHVWLDRPWTVCLCASAIAIIAARRC
jgi:hypothetical protein